MLLTFSFYLVLYNQYLTFSIDALSIPSLILSNFKSRGSPVYNRAFFYPLSAKRKPAHHKKAGFFRYRFFSFLEKQLIEVTRTDKQRYPDNDDRQNVGHHAISILPHQLLIIDDNRQENRNDGQDDGIRCLGNDNHFRGAGC